MMRILLGLVLVSASLFAYTFDTLLLRAEATVFPKVVLLSRSYERTLVDQAVLFCIVYDEDDESYALALKSMIEEKYPNGIGYKKIQAKILPYGRLTPDIQATAFFAMPAKEESMQMLAAIARSKKIISFVYDKSHLRYGFLVSLAIERAGVLYFNRSVLKEGGFDFENSIFAISRFIER